LCGLTISKLYEAGTVSSGSKRHLEKFEALFKVNSSSILLLSKKFSTKSVFVSGIPKTKSNTISMRS
jgi:hypothetical protein